MKWIFNKPEDIFRKQQDELVLMKKKKEEVTQSLTDYKQTYTHMDINKLYSYIYISKTGREREGGESIIA